MIVEGHIKTLLDIYNVINSNAFITLDDDGFIIHTDVDDFVCYTLGGFIEFIENDIKEILYTMFIEGQYTELKNIIDELN